MTGTVRPDEEETPAVADDLGLRGSSVVSWLVMAVSLLTVALLTWITISVIRSGGTDDEVAETADTIESSSGDQAASDEVAVSIGTEGHRVLVACFLPSPTTPPLVVFASSAPVNVDLQAETTLIDSEEETYRTVADAKQLRPGEQRQAVPRTVEASTVVVENRIKDCRIESVQADRQIVRFG